MSGIVLRPGMLARAAWRMLALATALGVVVTAIVGACPGTALASSVAQRAVRHRAPAVPGAGLTLAQAPAGLRAAVRRTLHTPAAPAVGGSPQAGLAASDGATNDMFGVSVALSGSTAVVGALGVKSNTGAAYVFIRSGSTWSQQAELTASGGAPGDDFGLSVAISGPTAVVGAPGTNSLTGAAYLFEG
jgi:FG-GAP repeat protein